MSLDVASLPDDARLLRALPVAANAGIGSHDRLIERLTLQIARLRRMQFGKSSEKVAQHIKQLALALEKALVETAAAAALVPEPIVTTDAVRRLDGRDELALPPRRQSFFASTCLTGCACRG